MVNINAEFEYYYKEAFRKAQNYGVSGNVWVYYLPDTDQVKMEFLHNNQEWGDDDKKREVLFTIPTASEFTDIGEWELLSSDELSNFHEMQKKVDIDLDEYMEKVLGTSREEREDNYITELAEWAYEEYLRRIDVE